MLSSKARIERLSHGEVPGGAAEEFSVDRATELPPQSTVLGTLGNSAQISVQVNCDVGVCIAPQFRWVGNWGLLTPQSKIYVGRPGTGLVFRAVGLRLVFSTRIVVDVKTCS